ncbi:putative disease resistance protein RGA3 isoform X1 [Quercus robur]|uniref:putative disease resistance protein RGA3 isoform X1 n=1 Tax=Quercus robur TaxID=38942 RepID=UPI002161D3D3|nr:putative disease resistance protein RGA3 isoform X1 [Quercus robur]XP_050273411.1 putative disease resistance protein RGA3 isoform X1 [Quercus robur]XP_050273412.1 putative disease resistance protein RGA3 isoform X1 [Quercus robur]XP_050273413.1 putative disease resistance protein RGA3 isoform X1 [Quercus robur]XP_050273415.1 putative disease resistance protein RGA3 isoform X1 [Quercus robur]XP_050273416.1 putative disease resistance protein RGA3 isoform X1 [Quercus robur]XP_050273417.1 pu
MAEGLVTDLIKQLLSTVARDAEQEVRLVVGVDKEAKKLEDNLRTVRAVLNDAEKRQVTEEAVKLWLEKLNNVCYEMEDVVDEWNTELIKSAIQKEEEEKNADNAPALKMKKQVCSFIPSPSCCFGQVDKLARRHDIAHKIKELNGILDEIVKEKDRYWFQSTNDPATIVVERPQTASLVDESDICGRDRVKDDLVGMLLGEGSEEERSPHLISLVGMGGIGKTTLAQLAYNDPKVQAHFKIKVWVCVSNPFDQCKVAKEILESINVQSSDLTALDGLLKRIQDNIKERKFFLVLDDVWTEDSTPWDPFRIALKCVAQGSRIIVTTRKRRVAEIMGSVSMIDLKKLSKEDCWLVFSKRAFFNRDPRQCEQLEGLGRQIVEKCRGLPLAAKTLGSLMQFKSSIEEWRRVLDSNLWELDIEEIKSNVYAPLLLSYYSLSSPLRRCFSFCAVFPKNYVFSSDALVYMWMAQGYIELENNMDIEITARDYFENLAIHSFFQDFERDENDGKIEKCKMHDIVHDFAQLMSKNVCFTINSNTRLETDYKTARHLELEIPKEAQYPEFIYSAKNLRTLIIVNRSDYMLSTLFQHFRCLRTLTLEDVEDSGILRNLPDAMENFIHLRYLNLVNYCGDALPETICNLCNLQILNIDIESDRFQKLPQGMSKLINLRHFGLGFKHDFLNIKFPRGFGRLTSLRTLKYFIVNGKDDSERCKLGELINLNHLQGTLVISGLGSEVDECEAMNAQLKKKINLHTLALIFKEWDGEQIIREKDALVLNALEPPPNLEYLRIASYKAPIMFPNWMMSLTNLKNLVIGHSSLECLPPLGKLPFLKSLEMWDIKRFKKLGVEFMGIEESEKKEKGDIIIPLFPNLISLSFMSFCNWEEWNGIEEEEDCIRRFTIMPRLQHLHIWNCRKLKSMPNFLRTTPLQKLLIEFCPILKERCKRGTGKEWPKISHIPNIEIDEIYVQRDGGECEFDPKEYEEEFVEDDDKKEESNEDEVDKEEDDKALHDKKEDDEAEHL